MRKAFTLIELIFVIVIIGLLAAVAVPKFTNLKQNAEANNVVKSTIDAAQQAAEAAVNLMDMEDNDSFSLRDIVKLDGKGWTSYDETNSTDDLIGGRYEFNDTNGLTVVEINLSLPNREVNYSINCANFADKTTREKCAKRLNVDNDTDKNKTFVSITF